MLRLPYNNNIVASGSHAHRDDGGQQKIARPLANFPEKISAAPFISFNLDKKECERYATEIQKSKEEVRQRIVDRNTKVADKLNLIDTVERLGVHYHFEEEIEEQLNLIHSSSTQNGIINYSNLTTAALAFRLFRQHGLTISSDIFLEEFTCRNGKFKKCLTTDIKGLLNLYEATFVRTRKDSILDEAHEFTRNHLSNLHISSGCPFIDRQVKYALNQSIHRGVPRYEARYFISFYEEYNLKNTSLLRLAKLEFNLSQLFHRQELSTALRWWKELDITSNIPYGRDRLVEYYFFSMGMFFEPRYSIARIMMTKYFAIGTFIDDTYDAYGTLEELKVFTNAIQRWDMSEVDGLPEYMKVVYGALLVVHDEFDQYAMKKGRPYAFHHIKEAWKEYARNSMIQSNWLLYKNNALPSFADYLSNGLRLTGIKLTAAVSYLLRECSESECDWLAQNPQLLVAVETVCRLHNDVTSDQFERERGSATPIDCYMNTYNIVSKEEAKKDVMEMSEDAWKDVNEECYSHLQQQQQKKLIITRDALDSIFNQVRLMDFAFKNNTDGWTDPKAVKPFISQVLLEPLPIQF